MDNFASVLLSFPPLGDSMPPDDANYHLAAKAHAAAIAKLDMVGVHGLASFARQLFDHVSPAFHSMSYLALIQATCGASPGLLAGPSNDLLDRIVTFLMTFDPRQMRYCGKSLSDLLNRIGEGRLLPASIAVELMVIALLRLDPSGSMVTSHHLSLVSLAYETETEEAAFRLIGKPIVFYPGIKALPAPAADTHYPCDMTLLPYAYITPESGLTAKLSTSQVLHYDFQCALCYIKRRAWQQAKDALERVISFPTRDGACSRIMVEAYSKWILISLLLNGVTPTLPPTIGPGMQRQYEILGRPYLALARVFGPTAGPGQLKTCFEVMGANHWSEEGNLSLVRLVLAHHQRWQVLRLRSVYTKIFIEQLRRLTHNGETGEPLATAAEMEALVRDMIADGMLKGEVVRPGENEARVAEPGGPTPTNSSMETQPGAYLVFGDEPAEGAILSEEEFDASVKGAARRLASLEPIVKATKERLGLSPEWIKLAARDRKGRDSLELGHGGRGREGTRDRLALTGGGGEYDEDHGDEEFEDEDLMTGLTSAST